MMVGVEDQIQRQATLLQRRDVQRAEEMHAYGTFKATETADVPSAYLVPAEQTTVLDRLAAHGIEVASLEADTTLHVERFRIDSTQVAPREYQGHRAQTVFGAYEEADVTLAAGTVQVFLDQPLGRLAFYLLEPRADDGLLAWGLVEVGEDATLYPILRIP